VSAPPVLLAVPNVSEGRDRGIIDDVASAHARAGAQVLDLHTDPDHGRTVFTLAAPPHTMADALVAGAEAAIARIDLTTHTGLHPHVGAVDVVPVVFLDDDRRGAACAEALVVADRFGDELGLPVFLYGDLAGGRTRAELRRGGRQELARRLQRRELQPDFGPDALHPTAGATLVAARAPLIAFNIELAPPATLADARRIAADIREGGRSGLPGVRALAFALPARGGVAQVSFNVEDHRAVPLARLLHAVERRAPVAEAELVGLAPRAAFDGWPDRVPVRNRASVEDALRS